MMFSVPAGSRAGVSGRAGVLAAAVLCLLLVKDVAYAAAPVFGGEAVQVPFVVAIFVIPLLFAFRGPRLVLARGRWVVLAVQGLLTWVPFAVFGGRWQVGVGGLLAGLVLLTVPGLISWLIAGALLAADITVRAGVVGLPQGIAAGWPGALWAAVAFTDLGLAFFGVIRLAQLVGELQEAQDEHTGLAVAAERLQATRELQSAVGERLDGIATMAAAARQALARDPGKALAQVTAAGSSARQAVAQARAVAVGRRVLPQAEPSAPPGGAVIGARLAWAVLVVVLCGYACAGFLDAVGADYGPRRTAFVVAGVAASILLQLRHSWAARQGRRPWAWPVTLGLQAVLAYAFFLPPIRAVFTLSPFLAGSILLLVPGRWRWAGYAAVAVSWAALYATVPLAGEAASARSAQTTLYWAAGVAGIGLLVYGLSWLAGMAAELEAVRAQLARMAAVRERLRVARDVHDLLGLGLSAIALKTDLIGKLVGRDDDRAAAEIGELGRTCAAARADIRLVTGDGQKLSVATELAAASQILASAGVQVTSSMPTGRLPVTADSVLAVVLREAVTNILRHSAATSCAIEVGVGDSAVRLVVSNNGVTGAPGGEGGRGAGGSTGLANLTARVQAAGGQLSTSRHDGSFELTVEIPLPGPRAFTETALQPAGLGSYAHRIHPVASAELNDRRSQVVAHRAVRQVHRGGDLDRTGTSREHAQHLRLARRQRVVRDFQCRQGQLRVDHSSARGDGADRIGQIVGGDVFDQEPGHVRGYGTAQVPRIAQHSQDQHPARRALLVQPGRRGKPVDAGQVDVDNSHVRALADHRRHDGLAVGDLRHHLDVIF
jgi:two-component system, NarL family, sensor histidine kinase DesK